MDAEKPIVIPTAEELRAQGYWEAAQRPLQGLVFLLPLVGLYAAGVWAMSLGWLGGSALVLAYELMRDGFSVFGARGLLLPALAVPAILLLWHLLLREPWARRHGVLPKMWLECLVLALGLTLLHRVFDAPVPLANALPQPGEGAWQLLLSKLVLSVGAGLFEELLFRLMLMTLISLVLVDVLGVGPGASAVVSVVLSGLLFSAYHHLGPEPLEMGVFLFRWSAGMALALIFLARGFAIAVGAHAAYDVIVTLSSG